MSGPVLIRPGQRMLHLPGGVVQARAARARGGVDLLADLVEYWDLDEASGVRVGSHAGLDLTDNNTVGQAAGVGAGQTAADFVAANSETLSSVAAALLLPAPWSFACWAYFDTAARQGIVDTKTGINAIGGYRGYHNTNGNLVFQFRNVGGGTSTVGNSSAVALIQGWNLVFLGHDGSTWYARTNTNAKISGAATFENQSTDRFVLGRTADYHDGRIQAAGTWSRVLSDDEIDALYNGGASALLYADL